jgi:hypothetical protein
VLVWNDLIQTNEFWKVVDFLKNWKGFWSTGPAGDVNWAGEH